MASVIESLGSAAVAIVTPIAAALNDPASVVQRKRAVMAAGDTTPKVVVAVDEARDFEPASAYDDGAWYGYYRLTVAYFRPNATQAGVTGASATQLNRLRQFRQDVRRAVTLLTLAANGATYIDDCDPVARPTLDRRALDANYDYAAVQFIVRTMEPRT